MNILLLVDKSKSAIGRLADTVKLYNPHLNIKVLPLHPKRPDAIQLADVIEVWDMADVVHISYWKSGAKFKELYPERWGQKRKILWHHNPYDIDKDDWQEDYKRIVVHNSTIHSMIPYAHMIPQSIDLNFFEFNDDYTEENVVQMVIGRIEGKKGAREVAKACKELGYKFILVGKISKRDYFNQIMEVNPDTDFRENVSDEDLLKSYHESAIHVCNSVDNFESGTMPILEAMATGVAVLTRNIGHVPDLYDGANMVCRGGGTEDYEDLREELKNLMENRALRLKMREKAWETVKNRTPEKMARMFSSLYYQVNGEKKPLVSIIVPTLDKPKVLLECLARIANQDYKNIEVIVVDSGNNSVEILATGFRKHFPVKYIRFENNGEYTLPKARNLGVIEAQGEYVLLCDERIGIEPTAISEFAAKEPKNDVWLYGEKDGTAKGFVENFSFVKRETLIKYGMFNERIDCYGGASQEVRQRFGKHGVLFEIVTKAKANQIAKSGNFRNKKKDKARAKYILWKLYGSN